MNARLVSAAILALLIAASAASAMSSSPGSPPPPPQSGGPEMSRTGEPAVNPRAEAEQSYALAYEEVAKAKKDLEDGKAKNAAKRFQRALGRCEQAVELDERYHEAWNLLGYTARQIGDYDRSFKAYDRCLAIKPDYAPAREYLGEAWLDKGDAKKARDQMVWLERLGATEELKTLKTRYDAWIAAHPEPPATPSIPPDSTAAGAGSSGH